MNNNKAKLLAVGTVAIDSINTPFGDQAKVFGGSASYFSYAASFFTPVSLVGVVGEDFPDEYRAILQEHSIDLSHLKVESGKTFAWKGFYENDMNSANTLETHLNVLENFDPKIEYDHDHPFVFLANMDPALQDNSINQINKPKLKFLASDTMNFWIDCKKDALVKVLSRIDCLVLNDAEARQLTGEPNLIKAGQMIRNMGPGYVVIKKGEHGVLVIAEHSFSALPAFPLETVFDPTGAGDSFAGGLMGYLASTEDVTLENLKRGIAYGTVVASFTVEKFGLERLREISMDDIEERLELFRKISSF